MRTIRPSNEAEVIAGFLRQEYASRDRYGARLDACLRDQGMPTRLITDPDLTRDDDNAARRRLFGRYRGYGTGEPSYLTGFPTAGVDWFWAGLSREEVLGVRYIRYSYWIALSAGTRSPMVAAEHLRRDRGADRRIPGDLPLGRVLIQWIRVGPDRGERRT